MQFAEWEGYLMVVGLFLLQMMQTVFINLSYAMSMRTGYYLRTAIISSIFKKSLRLSARARRDHTSGKIMNMISTDTNRLDLSFMIVHFLWSAPLQILIAFGMLWWYMGPTCLVGFAVIVMSIPFQLWVVRKQGEMRDRASKVADQRIKILQELLQGIKVVKLYAWEDSFAKLLDQIRKNELKSVAWLLGMYALNAGLMQVFVMYND
jgi:ABC-type multidrug transport system fused ATPase/permease subunit